MSSSHIQHPQEHDSSISIEILESSIQNLIKAWLRREKWHLCFNSHQDDEHCDDDLHNKRAPWRIHLAKFLESNPIRLLALSLILLDLVFTVLDLSSSLLSCTSKKNDVKQNVVYHWGGIAILSVLTMKMLALVVAL
ncbi:voltage-gated hydrogen channel-like protein, partial [Thalictrum thalictroides]